MSRIVIAVAMSLIIWPAAAFPCPDGHNTYCPRWAMERDYAYSDMWPYPDPWWAQSTIVAPMVDNRTIYITPPRPPSPAKVVKNPFVKAKQ